MQFSNDAIKITTRIVVVRTDGSTSSGTGFFCGFNMVDNHGALAIVTNKHVIQDYDRIEFILSKQDSEGNLIQGSHKVFGYQNANGIAIEHPEVDVDLAIIPIEPILEFARQNDHMPHYGMINYSALPDKSELSSLPNIQKIVMVGYPNAIWDEHNNTPIVRSGVTATPVSTDFKGRKEFVIDCACFPGSSGSPVFAHDLGVFYSTQKDSLESGERTHFLGILYGGPQASVKGDLITIEQPHSIKVVSESYIPLNLGYCIKREKLGFFENLLKKDFKTAAESITIYMKD